MSALQWYASRAADLARYTRTESSNINAIAAVVQELALDGGRRGSTELSADQWAEIAQVIASEFDLEIDEMGNSEFMTFIAAAHSAIRKYQEII